MEDKVVILKISGKIMKEILENGVSMWPKYDGRWVLTSGIKFKFDPEMPVGNRILPDSLTNDEGDPIEMDKIYSLASKYFI